MKHRLRQHLSALAESRPKAGLVRFVILFGSLFFTSLSFGQRPNSYIVLPIQVQLQPLFAAAEASVDSVFTSPGWPDGWVEADCATRYKYRFRRQPLRFVAQGNRLQIAFTGLYQIVGSTRGCVGKTVISPWTPACRCGFDEGERRVEVGFVADVQITPTYQLITTVKRLEPRPADKCTVCFWGQDITAEVMKGLKAELDASVKTMSAAFGRIDMKPFVTQAWNRLSAPYPISGLGTFHLQPSAMSLQQLSASGNLLNLTLGLAAAPQVNIQGGGTVFPLPNLGKTTAAPGFIVNMDAALPYDSLSAVVTGAAKGKRIEVSEGLIKKHIIIQDIKFAADTAGKLAMHLGFDGSFRGTVQKAGCSIPPSGCSIKALYGS